MRKTAATDPYILPVWPYHIRTGYDQLTCKKFAHPYRLHFIWYRYSCWVYRHLLIEDYMTMQFVCTNIQKLYLSPWLNVEILDVHANHAWKQFFLSLLLQALYADPVRPSTHKCGSNECYLDSKSSHLTKVAWLKSFQPLHGPTSLSELRTIKDWSLHISHFHILAATGRMHTTPTNAASHDLTYQGFTYWKVCLQLIVQWPSRLA